MAIFRVVKRNSWIEIWRRWTHSHPPPIGQHKIKKTHLERVKTKEESWDVKKVRNIGIIAHIDAGKTTTTERMLYLAGVTKSMGNVDDGDTVTDYMAQERERGITITSAAITFYWNRYRINLIDTPGHVDFTLEVERSLRVLDGAVIILDASKGVEAQTMTVWRQAKKFRIPSIIFLNKLDKPTASVDKCMKSIKEKLKITPILVNSPIGDGKNLRGVTDLITLENLEWSEESDGKSYTTMEIEKSSKEYASAVSARDSLIGALTDLDDEFADAVLNCPSTTDVPSSVVDKSLRKATLSRQIMPVFCGSSLKMKGVQSILTAVCKYLPSPVERRHTFLPFYGENNLCALAFKIITDHFLGRMTFLRVYGGEMKPNMKIYNVNRDVVEKVQRIYVPHSDEMQETDVVTAGNIVAVPGFTNTITGDTLVQSSDVAKLASHALEKLRKERKDDVELDEVDTTFHDKLVLASIEAPDPVFFCSIEPPSLSTQKTFDAALDQLVREDPSIRVRVDADSLQTILEGMGELQIEIVKDRLLREFDLDVFLGPMQINYKETIASSAEHSHEIVENHGAKHYSVSVVLRADRFRGSGALKSIDLDKSSGDFNTLMNTPAQYLDAVKLGCINACMHGPVIGYPVLDIRVTLCQIVYSRGTPPSLVTACAHDCLLSLMKKADGKVLEPLMKLEITVPEQYANLITNELAKKRANIDKSEWLEEDHARIIFSTAPLSELLGFAKTLRTLSSGNADLHMQLSDYQVMTDEEVALLKAKLSGFR